MSVFLRVHQEGYGDTLKYMPGEPYIPILGLNGNSVEPDYPITVTAWEKRTCTRPMSRELRRADGGRFLCD